MAGKNSVTIPVSLELQTDDVVKDYQKAIGKSNSINDLQKQFNDLLKMQEQYLKRSNEASDPIAKALDLQGIKIYSKMLSEVIRKVKELDSTKLSSFTIPKLEIDGKEIVNNVAGIETELNKAIKSINSLNSLSTKSDVSQIFKGIGKESIEQYYKDRIAFSKQAVISEVKNNKLSLESLNKLLDATQQYEVFKKKIVNKNGTIGTDVTKIIPKSVLESKNFPKDITLDDLQVRWKKITTPDFVKNTRAAILENISSIAQGKSFSIPTDGLLMDSSAANDFGARQRKINEAEIKKEVEKQESDLEKLDERKEQINKIKQTISDAYTDLISALDTKGIEATKKITATSRLIVEELGKLKELGSKDINLEHIVGEAYIGDTRDGRNVDINKILSKAGIILDTPDLSDYAEIEDSQDQYNDLFSLLEDLNKTKKALTNNDFKKILDENNIDVAKINEKFKALHESFVQAGVDFKDLLGDATQFQTLIGEVFGNQYILPEFKGTGTGSGSGNGISGEISSEEITKSQKDYADITAELEKIKAEAEKAKNELKQVKASSVKLGEGEQVTKGNNPEVIKEFGEAIKALQERMTKAEDILKDVPEGMNGLKQLSNQIQKMSGNFNNDGSIKNLETTAELLSDQLKKLEAEFDARIEKKIAELEKKSYKEKSPNRKIKLAGSLKDLKLIVNKPQNDISTSTGQTAQQNTATKTEETTQELYKETTAYKALSEEVMKYNELTAQKLGETDFDARIKRLQDMQACVKKIIAIVESYDGKASELSELVLRGKKRDISIQDTTKLDNLNSKLKDGVDKNIERKERYTQLKEEAQQYESIIKEYDQNFQKIISGDVTSGKQFNAMKQNLRDLSNSLQAIMDKYDTLKEQEFYSSDIANYGDSVWGKVKDASLDLDEIKTYKNNENEILTIQSKYSESLKNQKQEQDKVAEAARQKAEAEKEAAKAATESGVPNSDKMSVADRSREEQKRKALERQAGINTDNASGFAGSSQKEIDAIGLIDKAVQELTQHIKDKNSAISDEVEAMKSASTAEINTLKTVQEQVSNIRGNLGGTIAGQITMPDNNTPVVPQTNSTDTAVLTGEITEASKLKTVFENVTSTINSKTEAIKTEAVAMSEAAQSEVGDVDKIGNAVSELSDKISAIAQINISNANIETPITLPVTVNDTQITTIREKIAIAFNENNPIPISFIPKIDGIREQISKAIGKAPIELKSSKTNNIFKIEKLTVSKKVVSELKRSIAEQLDSVKIKSFDVKSASGKMKSDLAELLSDVKLRFNTEELESDIKEAMENAAAQGPKAEEPENKSTSAQKNAYEKAKKDIDRITEDVTKANTKFAQFIPENLQNELRNTLNDLNGINPLSNLDDADALTEWVNQSQTIINNWDTLNEKIQNSLVLAGHMAEYYASTMTNVDYTAGINKDLDKTENKFKEAFKGEQFEAFNTQLSKIRAQLEAINSGTITYDSSSVQSVMDEMSVLNNMTDRFTTINNSKNDLDKFIATLTTAQNSVRGRGTQGEQFTNEINTMIGKINDLKARQDTLATGTDEDIAAFVQEVQEAGAAVDDLKKRTSNFKIGDNAVASAEKLKAKFDDLIYKAQDFKNKNTKMNRDAGLAAQFNELIQAAQTAERSTKSFNELNARFNALKSTVMSKGLTGRSLGDELSYIASKIGLKAMLGGSVYQVLGYFRQMVTVVKELDTGMTNLKRVSEETEATYQKFMDSAAKKARDLGSTMQQVIDATTDFSRLGYNLQEASALANNALMYSNVGEIDINQASSDMISALKAFNIASSDSIHVVDVFNKLGNEFAVTAANIGEGLSQSASALAVAGNDFEESASMITAITEITQDASSAGNALKTLSLRLRSTSTDLSEAGEDSEGACTSIAKLQEKMKALAGVDILNSEGTFRSTYDIIKDIAHNWDNIADMDRSGIIETLGGKTRAEVCSYVQQCA